jgi:hypothetical protein
VPQSDEKTSDRLTELPNPELNPLLNATLGRNLGRWAQVYFTSPPEKREEAVEELLRELQGQAPNSSTEPPPANAPARLLHNFPNEENQNREPDVKCSECGQRYSSPQRFCGMCGAPLVFSQPDDMSTSKPALRITEEPEVTSPMFGERHEYSPSIAHDEVGAYGDDGTSDIRWLREKPLSEQGLSWRPRYAPAIVALLAIGVLIYAQWRPTAPQQRAGTVANPGSTTSPAASPGPTKASEAPDRVPATSTQHNAPAPNTTAEAISSEPPARSSETESGKSEPGAPPAPPASKKPADERAGHDREPASLATALPSATNGAVELVQAEDYLNGKKHPRDSAQAAKYLWKAVGKENATAALLLSDMYRVGDGVPKSCDQARLLLTAAARKGAPQAADKLRDLLRSGCR